MDTARRQLSGVEGHAAGESDLIDALHEFADDWKYGITQIGKHTDSTVQMIDQIGKTFDQVDVELANSLNKSGGK
nr:hypothetical protein [Streptomyces sp. SID5468]